MQPGGSHAEVVDGLEQPFLLRGVEGRDQAGHAREPHGFHLADETTALVGESDQDEASIRGVAGALDDAALLEASDDAGRVRKRHADLVGKAGHRQRAVHLEQRDDLEPDHRQPVRLATRRPRAAVVGEKRRQRVDDLGRAVAGCHVIDCHLDHYGYRNHSVKRNGCLCLSHSAAVHPDVDGLWIAAATWRQTRG